MQDWSAELGDKKLNELYENYIFRQNQTLLFYISSAVLSHFTEFPQNSLNQKLRASHNFHESATSIAQVRDVKTLIDSGSFDQQARSFSIIALLTTFTDFFEGLRIFFDIKPDEYKRLELYIFSSDKKIQIRPASLKFAFFISDKFGISSVLTKDETLLSINCWIKLRHMFMHNRGHFITEYANDMFRKWTNLNAGDAIAFDENDVDAIYWYLNNHLRAFVRELDKAIVNTTFRASC